MSADQVAPRLKEMRKDARKTLEQVEDAIRYHEAGNLQAVADTVALIRYPASQVLHEISDFTNYLAGEGIRPGEGSD